MDAYRRSQELEKTDNVDVLVKALDDNESFVSFISGDWAGPAYEETTTVAEVAARQLETRRASAWDCLLAAGARGCKPAIELLSTATPADLRALTPERRAQALKLAPDPRLQFELDHLDDPDPTVRLHHPDGAQRVLAASALDPSPRNAEALAAAVLECSYLPLMRAAAAALTRMPGLLSEATVQRLVSDFRKLTDKGCSTELIDALIPYRPAALAPHLLRLVVSPKSRAREAASALALLGSAPYRDVLLKNFLEAKYCEIALTAIGDPAWVAQQSMGKLLGDLRKGDVRSAADRIENLGQHAYAACPQLVPELRQVARLYPKDARLIEDLIGRLSRA